MQLLSFVDATTALTLGSLAIAERVFSDSLLYDLTKGCASLHSALRRSQARDIRGITRSALPIGPNQLHRDFLAGVYREMVYTLREHRRRGWHPETQLFGAEHLDDALRRGRGGILWTFPSTYGGLVGKKTLHAAGYEVAMLASHVHPYSGTRFGQRFLNPIRTIVEDRYIVERVTLRPGAEAVAMRRVMQLVGENRFVEIAAIGASDSPASFPFLGGQLFLALGAPTVAMMSGATLIPCFTVPAGAENFHVCIEAPLSSQSASDPRAASLELARAYVPVLLKHVMKAPEVWRGWFSRSNWNPPPIDS